MMTKGIWILVLGFVLMLSTSAQILEKKEGALTEAEKKAYVEWALKANTPDVDNWNNRWVLRYFYIEDIYWIYNMSGDTRIVDNLMSMAEKAVNRNNKRFMQELIHVGWDTIEQKPIGELLPGWPHKSDFGKDVKGKLVNGGDAGEVTVGGIIMSIAARTIIETPSLWDKKVVGKDYTYLERAKFYIDETVEVIELSFKRLYVDPITKEQQYQSEFAPEGFFERGGWQQKGVYSPFNRVWHAQTLFSFINPCLEQLNLYPEKVKEYDEISTRAIDMWIDKAMRKYEEKGIKMLDYPYRYAPNETTNSEDVGHCAYDVYELSAMYRSGRYPRMDNEIMTRFANTIVHKVSKGDGVFSYRLNGEGSGGKRPRNFFLQLKRFNPGIVDVVTPGTSQLLFARAFEEIEVNYKTSGDWIRTKSIAVKKGENLTIKATFPDDKKNWTWKGDDGFNENTQSITFNNIGLDKAGTYEVSYQPKRGVKRTNYIKVIVYDNI